MWNWTPTLALVGHDPEPCERLPRTASSDQVRELILNAQNVTDGELSRIVGLHRTTVLRIRHRRIQKNRAATCVSDETVDAIRVRHEDSGWTCAELAKHYGLSRQTVHAFLTYRRR